MSDVKMGPRQPATVTAQRTRMQHSKGRVGGTYTPMGSTASAFNTGANQTRGMATIPPQPSTSRNGGTQQVRQNKGRQGPI